MDTATGLTLPNESDDGLFIEIPEFDIVSKTPFLSSCLMLLELWDQSSSNVDLIRVRTMMWIQPR